MVINVLIVEDDPITCQDLIEILTAAGFKVSASASSYQQALALFHEHKPDLMLVDVKLRGEKDGIDLVEHIHTETYSFPVVYLTANSDSQTKERAFKTNPAVFLTKPFREQDLINAIELSFSNYTSGQKNENTKKAFFIKTNQNYAKVMEVDILYIKAEGSYCRIITSDKEYVISKNLTSCAQELNFDHFIRVHRSYLVNSKKINSIDNQHLYIYDNTIPIGRNYRKSLKKIIHRLS